MLGAVGDDDLGRSALDGLSAEGVDVSLCPRLPGEHTGLALIVVDANGENQIAVAQGANARLDGAMVRGQTEQLAPPPGAVCLLGFEVGDAAVLAAAQWAVERGLRIVLNPAPARPIPAEILAAGPILTPNETEAAMLAGVADPEAAAGVLSRWTGAPVVVSLGADGALLWRPEGVVRLPATRVTPVDTTGAGDALNGILAAELARGASLEEALRWAMVGAALKTTQSGAQAGLPTRAVIAAHLAASADGTGEAVAS
jgi:ribokinase